MRTLTVALLAVLLLGCEQSTQPTIEPSGIVSRAEAEEMNPIGIRAWYSGNRFFERPAAEFSQLSGWPSSGWLITIVYLDQDYLPGLPYRMIYEGTDNFIYNPSATGLAKFENTDETRSVARQRLGNQIVYFNGQLIPTPEFQAIEQTALARDTWP